MGRYSNDPSVKKLANEYAMSVHAFDEALERRVAAFGFEAGYVAREKEELCRNKTCPSDTDHHNVWCDPVVQRIINQLRVEITYLNECLNKNKPETKE